MKTISSLRADMATVRSEIRQDYAFLWEPSVNPAANAIALFRHATHEFPAPLYDALVSIEVPEGQLIVQRPHPAYALAGVLVCLAGCASAPDRPARSSIGCAETTLDQHLPSGLSDKRAHCIAGGLIARFCSPAEARLSGLGKEMRDAFGPGDADWSDWQATRAGVRCAASAGNVASIVACCENEPPGKNKHGDPPP